MNIGSHIPSKNAVEEIKLRKGDTFQIFVSSPQMWKSPKPREDIDALQDYKGPIYVHAPYLINVATPNNKVRHPSRKLLKDTCKVAASFGAKAVIVHGGSVGEGGDIAEGIRELEKSHRVCRRHWYASIGRKYCWRKKLCCSLYGLYRTTLGSHRRS